jgi:hypothetical protein
VVDRALSAVSAAVSSVVEPPVTEETEPPPVKTARGTPWAIRVAGLAVLVAAATWTFHDISWSRVAAVLGRVNPLWIAFASGVYMVAVYAMAGRWREVLRPLVPRVSQPEAFKAMVVGFAASIVVPARGGELARAEWLGWRMSLPRATILGSILLDHLVAATGLFTAVALLPLLLDLPRWLDSGIWLALGVFVVVLGLVVVFRPRAGMPALGGTSLPRGRVAAAVAGFLARARLGLTAMSDRRALARAYGASLAAWFLETSVVYFTLYAFHIHVTPGDALFVLVAINMAMVVPFAPPGNIGTVEVGAILALMELGVPKEQALAFALVYHLLQVIPIGVSGLALASRSLLPAPVPQSTRT